MKPSAYFKRQCVVSVEYDEEPTKAVHDVIGVDNVLFCLASFSHPDCKYPGR